MKWVPPTLGTDHGQSGCGASPHPWGQSREWEPPAREAASVSAICHGVALPTASRLPPPATGSLCAPQMATGCPVSGPPSLCVRPAPALGFLSQNWLVALTWPSLRVPVPQAKVEMLDNLLDIEVAYSLLRGGSEDSSKDPIDVNYEKLKTDIKVAGPPS